MRYTILIAALLTGCGGGSSTPIATAPTEVASPPLILLPPKELTCPKVIPCPPEVTCPVIEDPVEPAPEIMTYYLISTATRDGDNIQERVYNEDGYLISDYNELENTWYKYAYDENQNQTSFVIESNGVVTSYTYATYDENSNHLTSVSSTGISWVATYNEFNQRTRIEIDYGNGITRVEVYTYEGDNQIKIEKLYENRVENKKYDAHGNMIYSDIWIDEVMVQVETYTWQEFTGEVL